jgi:Dynamin family
MVSYFSIPGAFEARTPSPPVFGTTESSSVTLANSVYGLCTKELNEMVNQLRGCGADHVIQIPRIVVIGNQSAGKSTLMEAISGIKVPHATGRCTRVPLEVILTQSETMEWECRVSLRLDKDAKPVQFDMTRNKADVTLILRRAQLAILNSKEDISQFKTLTESECNVARYPNAEQFSSNVIVAEILGAQVDLTCIDLPGIIANTPTVFTFSNCADAAGGGGEVYWPHS